MSEDVPSEKPVDAPIPVQVSKRLAHRSQVVEPLMWAVFYETPSGVRWMWPQYQRSPFSQDVVQFFLSEQPLLHARKVAIYRTRDFMEATKSPPKEGESLQIPAVGLVELYDGSILEAWYDVLILVHRDRIDKPVYQLVIGEYDQDTGGRTARGRWINYGLYSNGLVYTNAWRDRPLLDPGIPHEVTR